MLDPARLARRASAPHQRGHRPGVSTLLVRRLSHSVPALPTNAIAGGNQRAPASVRRPESPFAAAAVAPPWWLCREIPATAATLRGPAGSAPCWPDRARRRADR